MDFHKHLLSEKNTDLLAWVDASIGGCSTSILSTIKIWKECHGDWISSFIYLTLVSCTNPSVFVFNWGKEVWSMREEDIYYNQFILLIGSESVYHNFWFDTLEPFSKLLGLLNTFLDIFQLYTNRAICSHIVLNVANKLINLRKQSGSCFVGHSVCICLLLNSSVILIWNFFCAS